MAYEQEKTTLGLRLRRQRLTAGLSAQKAADAANVTLQTWTRWEQGRNCYRPWRAPVIAAALGIPTQQLFTDACVLAEFTLREETLQRVRDEGPQAIEEAANAIVGQLKTLILEASTRRPVDVRPGARAKRRRTRAEVLAGVKAADRASARRRELVSQAPAFTIPDT